MKLSDMDPNNLPKSLTDEQLTQQLIPIRFIPDKPEELKDKNVVYVFDSSDSFDLTYDELVEIVSKARKSGPRMVPVLGKIGD